MPSDRLRTISNGIFFSLLSYGLQVYGTVPGLDRYAEGIGWYTAFSREDSHQIQIIMSVFLCALTSRVSASCHSIRCVTKCVLSPSLHLGDNPQDPLHRRMWPRWRKSKETHIPLLCTESTIKISEPQIFSRQSQRRCTQEVCWILKILPDQNY